MEEAAITFVGLAGGTGAWLIAKARALVGHFAIWLVTGVVGAMLGGLVIAPLLRALGVLGREPLVAGTSISTLLVAAICAGAALFFAHRSSRP